MREILFRGFHPCEDGDKAVFVEGKAVNGRWVEGIPINKNRQIIVSCFDIKELKDEDCMYLKGVIHKVIPSTVGQYTGIDDKNGVKIFEGDIVNGGFLRCNGNFEIENKKTIVTFKDGMFKCANVSLISFTKQYEVIGNIHEEGRNG